MGLFKVPLMEDESLTSFTSRLANANARSAMEICQDFGFSFRSVIAGRDDAISRLSEISSVAEDVLDAASVKLAGRKTVLVAGDPTPYGHYPRGIMKYCPACFLEDDGRHDIRPKVRRYMRKLWYSRAIRTCPVHDQSLVNVGSHGMADTVHDFCLALDGLRRDIVVASRGSVSQRFTPFEAYLRTRLSGTRPGNDLLDPLPHFVAADICELAGLVVLNGKHVVMKEQSEHDLWRAADKGYEYLASGHDGLHRLLAELFESTSTTRALNGGYQLFGRLYKVLANSRFDPAYDPVKDAIRSYAYKNLPLPDNVLLFGKGGPATYLSYSSLGKQYDLSPIIIRKVLQHAGRIRKIPGTDAEAVHVDDLPWLVELARDLIKSREAAGILGVSRERLDTLEGDGFIRPKIVRDNDSQLYRRYSRNEVVDLRNSLLARVNTEDPSGLMPILKICGAVGIKFGEVLHMIADGTLKTVGIDPSKSGIFAFMLAREEVAAVMVQADDRIIPENWMSADELANRLCTNDKGVAALLRGGHIKTTVVRNSRNFPMKGANREDVEAFAKKYVALAECIQRTQSHSQTLIHVLEDAGVTRVFPVVEMREVFLVRSEAEAALSQRKFYLDASCET